MERRRFDLVILGSGATAFAAAIRAAELGKTAAMTENRTLGGTCVNRGCLPSKNLIAAASIIYEAQHPRYPGIKSARLKVNFAELVGQKDEVIAYYREKKYQSIVGDRISVYEGMARFIDRNAVQVGDVRLEAERFLVATGSRPFIPPLEGLDEVPFMTSDLLTSHETMELKEQPESLTIVGGGYIALELGQFFHRLGTRVTILEPSERILPNHEPEVGVTLGEVLREEGITLLTGTKAVAVRRDREGVLVEIAGNASSALHSSHLLVATGRVPNTEGLGLDVAGVGTDQRAAIIVNDELETTAAHVWAAGDVVGSNTESQMATPVGAQDGGIAALNALGGAHRKVDHRVIPRAIFTDPEVAVVGLTDKEAVERGYRCACRTVDMEQVPRAQAVRNPRGVIKMVAERDSGKVLGVSMLGMDAAEVIHEAAMGIRFGAKVEDFVGMLHIYPTMSEALKIVALSFTKDITKLSCCAE
ncbi:MAG TPA: mercury(II) reductase [Candidatus Binataceae bacterium]|nr:mercury(II) reductase [Candidatus Binataceae bacterium]